MIRHSDRAWVVVDRRFGLSRERARSRGARAAPSAHRAELAPRSRLVDPRADELVRQMSERLARVAAFALEAEEVYDEVPEQSPRRQLTNLRRVAMRRPDRLVGDAAGDALNRSFWYDGKVFAALDREQNVWTSGAVPPTVDQALDWVFEQTGTVVPLADFLYADSYARLMEDVQRGVYLGIHEAAGVPCHHLSFEQATIDWQIWIDAGTEPLPRKLVITYKTEDEVPQYSVTIRKWNLAGEAAGRRSSVHAARGSARGSKSPRLADRLEPPRENGDETPTDGDYHGHGACGGLDRGAVCPAPDRHPRIRLRRLQRQPYRAPKRAGPPRSRDSGPAGLAR